MAEEEKAKAEAEAKKKAEAEAKKAEAEAKKKADEDPNYPPVPAGCVQVRYIDGYGTLHHPYPFTHVLKGSAEHKSYVKKAEAPISNIKEIVAG